MKGSFLILLSVFVLISTNATIFASEFTEPCENRMLPAEVQMSPDELDLFIEETMENSSIFGSAACIVRNSRICQTGYYGLANIAEDIPVTENTVFLMVSVSKTVTATALMQLWEDGEFRLDDPINDRLENFQVIHPDFPNTQITYRMLLTHTASIADVWDGERSFVTWEQDYQMPLGDFLEAYLVEGGQFFVANDNFLRNVEPGGPWHYSSIGSALIGYLVECISGVPFEDYCQENIFDPLGMESASWFLEEFLENRPEDMAIPYNANGQAYHQCHWGPWPAAMLRCTVPDFTQFLLTINQYGSNGDVTILDSATVDMMMTVEVERVNAGVYGIHDVGLHWARMVIDEIPYWNHVGSWWGAGNLITFHLPTDTGTLYFTNRKASEIFNSITNVTDGLHDHAREWMNFGVMEGQVVDVETDEAIEGAVVSTTYGRTAETDEEGCYFLPFGDEMLTASIPGYNDLFIENLEIAVDETLEVNFELTHPEMILTIDEFNAELNQNESTEESFEIRNDGNGLMDWWVERCLQGEAGVDPFELRRSMMVGQAAEDNSIQGVVFIDGLFYVSGRHDDNPQIYVFNSDCELVRSFDQPGDDIRGFKDLAWDGNLMWGAANNIVYGFDLEGEVHFSFNSPIRSGTSFAWDPDRELLWMCSTTSDIIAIDTEGNVHTELDDHGLRIYGLAYWSEDPDGYPVYSFAKESETNRPFLHKFNPDEDEFMLVSYLDTEIGGSPSGIFVAENYDVYSSALIAIANDGGDDRIDVWQLQPNVSWMIIDPEEGELDPESETEISLTLDATDLASVLWEGELVFDHAVAIEETRIPITLNVQGDGDQPRDLIVPLDVNWNMISINVTPPEEMWEREEGPNVILMTEQLRVDEDNHHLILMKNEDGMFYLPAFGFNNIPYWDLTEGYLVKVDEDIEAVWSGEPIPADADIPLEQDWNLIAYYPTYQLDASSPDNYVLSPIIDNVLIAKDGDGNFMLPAFNFSNMPPWRETQGNQVRVDEEVVLNYPEEREELAFTPPYPLLETRVGGQGIVLTGENMSLLITCKQTKSGEQIGAFNTNGKLVGIGTVESDGRCGLAVWGDDPATDEVDGLLDGEVFDLRLLDTGQNLLIESQHSGSGLVYKADEFTVMDVIVESTIPTEFYLSQAYPNPFNSTTRITYGLPVTSNVSLKLYDLSGRLIQTLVEGEKQAGIQTTILNAAELPSGLYFVRLSASGHVFTRKVMLVR